MQACFKGYLFMPKTKDITRSVFWKFVKCHIVTSGLGTGHLLSGRGGTKLAYFNKDRGLLLLHVYIDVKLWKVRMYFYIKSIHAFNNIPNTFLYATDSHWTCQQPTIPAGEEMVGFVRMLGHLHLHVCGKQNVNNLILFLYIHILAIISIVFIKLDWRMSHRFACLLERKKCWLCTLNVFLIWI